MFNEILGFSMKRLHFQ